jgi:HEAT repeat protein
MGLIGRDEAAEPLAAALSDPAPIVQGRAAEALGTIGHAASASAIAAMALPYVPAAAAMAGDTERAATPEADAWRLAAYALVKLRDYDALSTIVLADAAPVTTWWPAAFAL